MRLLLTSDTHGKLTHLNALAAGIGCEAIIHAGDFGFHDDESVERLTERELMLCIVHSGLTHEEKQEVRTLSSADRRSFVRQNLPLSDLPRYLRGEERFEVPIFAAWGNHEDLEVVSKFRSGEYRVDNLNILHEAASFHLHGVHVFGLGGNFLLGPKLFQPPTAGAGGRIWSVLEQYARLLDTVDRNAVPNERRLLVSHVSPGKEPFVTLLGALAGSHWIVSGHMAPPFVLAWNEFAVRTPEEAERRLQDRVAEIEQVLAGLDERTQELNGASMSRWSALPHPRVILGRGVRVPAWYVNMWSVNLPDAATGHAVLDLGAGSTGSVTGYRSGNELKG